MPILDYDDEFTTNGGQSCAIAAGTTNGTKVKNAGGARDWAAGEPLWPYLRVVTAFTNLTSLKVDIVADTADDLVTDPTVLSSKTILLAALTVNSLHALPPLLGGTSKQYLGAIFTVAGTTETTGVVICGLMLQSARPQDGVNYL